MIRFWRLPLFLLCILTWMLAHPYQGIFHDANLYALQALSRLHPDSLANDVFLRFGSQDRFTVFSPAYAIVIRLLGIDHAASLLTLISQIALFAGGWYLARSVMRTEYALLGLVLIIAAPGEYGPARIFTYVEPFLTPRMGSEALVLGAIAAAFSARWFWCLALMAAAFAIHPIMAMAGAVALLAACLVPSHRRLSLGLICLVGASLLIASYALPPGEWGRLDKTWLDLLSQRSPYLFLSFWQPEDWSQAAVTLTILLVGVFTLDSRARLLCGASAAAAISGILLTALACDLLHLTLMTQLQPWRWLWLGTLTASMVLPMLIMENWQRGMTGRTTCLLLASAWIFGASGFALAACAATVLSFSFARLKLREQWLIFWGSCALFALALLWRISSDLELTDVHYMDAALPLWFRRSVSFVHDGIVPAALVCSMVWLARRSPRSATAWAYAALGITAIAGLTPYAWSGWTQQEFPPAQIARYAAWRDLIAPTEEVFWPESPLSTWVSLQRPSYISGLQTSGMIFSRPTALELERRAVTLQDFIGTPTFLSWSGASAHLSLSPEALTGICRLGTFSYLVTSSNLIDMQPVSLIDRLKLYRCTPQARAAAAAT